MRTRLTYIAFLLCLCLYAKALETVIVGTVIDERTAMPVENANVYYKGTNIGCATNNEGLFMVKTDIDKTHILLVSAVGYKTQRYRIDPGQYAGLEVQLREDNTVIQDIFVLPDNEPALRLLQQVRANREKNDITLTSLQTIQEQKELYISNISRRHLEQRLWRSLQAGMLQAEDSTMLIPLYASSQKWQLAGGQAVAIGQADEHSAVLTTTNYSVLLDGLGHRLNFYDNSISIFQKSFLSPLASTATRYYKYFLADSLLTQEGKQYVLHFRTKNPYEHTFNGEMLIDSATYALRQITAAVPREVSVNYLSSFKVRQQFDAEGKLQDEQTSMLFDFAIKTDSTHFFPTVLLKKQSVAADTDEMPQPSIQHSTATDAMDSLDRQPIVRVAKFIAHIVNTGNIPTGECVEIGNILDIFRYSHYEGARVGLPLTTTECLMRRVELSAYVAYGFRDRALKGMGRARFMLPTDRRNIIGISYTDDYTHTDVGAMDGYLHENSAWSGSQDITYALFGNLYKDRQTVPAVTRQRECALWTENDISKCVETKFAVRLGRMGYGSPLVGYHNIPSYSYSSLQAAVRLGWDERKTDHWFRRYYVHSRYPVVRLVGEAGVCKTEVMSEASPYARLTVMVEQTIRLGICGRLDYMAQAGVIAGAVPYPLLENFMANHSFVYDPYRFTLMSAYQYAADKYLMAHLHWNMEGLLFNKIPYIRALHLRELVELKFAYGGLSNRHNSVLSLPQQMQPLRIPYVEAGVGIGNILRVADLYAVFRLTNFKDNSAPWWAVRARFSFGL